MFYKVDNNGNIIASASVALDGFIEIKDDLKNNYSFYKIIEGIAYLRVDTFAFNDINEHDSKLDTIHADDKAVFTQKRKDIVNTHLKKDLQQNIENTIGNDKDLIKLVNMRMAFVERLVLVLAAIQFDLEISAEMKQNAQALTMLYLSKMASGEAKDTIDLEDYQTQLEEIIGANNFINDSVKEYRDKKEK